MKCVVNHKLLIIIKQGKHKLLKNILKSTESLRMFLRDFLEVFAVWNVRAIMSTCVYTQFQNGLNTFFDAVQNTADSSMRKLNFWRLI